jgi:hypothetical protein
MLWRAYGKTADRVEESPRLITESHRATCPDFSSAEPPWGESQWVAHVRGLRTTEMLLRRYRLRILIKFPGRSKRVQGRVSRPSTTRRRFMGDLEENRSRGSVVGIATDYGLDAQGVGVRVPIGSRIFCSPRCPDRFWGPPNLLFNGYRGLFPRGKAAGA